MELTVTQRRENTLLDRTEVHFSAAHPSEATPSRADLRKALAAALDAKGATVILDWARSEYGRTVTQGYAKVYKSKERAIELETVPILIRNGLVAREARPEAPKEEAPAPPKKEEPPKEAKPKEAKEPTKEPPKKEEKPAKREAPEKEPPKAKKAAKEEPPKEAKPAKAKEAAPKEKKAAKKEGK